MTDLDTIKLRAKQLNIAWMVLTTLLIALIVALVLDNIHLRDELAKPVPITQQQEHEIIKAYLAVGENKYALRKIIGCKE